MFIIECKEGDTWTWVVECEYDTFEEAEYNLNCMKEQDVEYGEEVEYRIVCDDAQHIVAETIREYCESAQASIEEREDTWVICTERGEEEYASFDELYAGIKACVMEWEREER